MHLINFFVTLQQIDTKLITTMKQLALIIMLMVPMVALAQQTTVGGAVIDEKSGRPLPQVSVSAGRISVVTNEDGAFLLKLGDKPANITVSHLGYKTKKVALRAGETENLKIKLQPTTIQLREVVIRTGNPRDIVEIAIKKIPDNYSRQPELLKAFYRETAMKRKHFIYVAEGVEDMYKTSYTRGIGRDRVAIIKGRRLLSQKQGDTLGLKVMGGPVLPVQLDVVKNSELLLNQEDMDAYSYSWGTPEMINDRLQMVVLMEPLFPTLFIKFLLPVGNLQTVIGFHNRVGECILLSFHVQSRTHIASLFIELG